mmetsp:Transcript_39236/g.77204  ORF Transcript_39236/g.77204 Transcript_39236/m.77204 type:complete len:168 (+) Transcript_39236:205-708(+)
MNVDFNPGGGDGCVSIPSSDSIVIEREGNAKAKQERAKEMCLSPCTSPKSLSLYESHSLTDVTQGRERKGREGKGRKGSGGLIGWGVKRDGSILEIEKKKKGRQLNERNRKMRLRKMNERVLKEQTEGSRLCFLCFNHAREGSWKGRKEGMDGGRHAIHSLRCPQHN